MHLSCNIMGIFVWILKVNMRYQIIVTHMLAASDQQISHFSQSWGRRGVLSVSGPVGKEIDKKFLPYVLIHGQETATLALCRYHFYCGISKGFLLESCLTLFSLFLSSGQLPKPITAGFQGTLIKQSKKKNQTCGTWLILSSILPIFIAFIKGSHSL